MNENTTPEFYDDDTGLEDGVPMTQEEILLNEGDILQGLLELGNEQNEEKNYRKIQIKRDGKLKLEFRLRPISEEESQSCWRMATRYAPQKNGQPKVAIETNMVKYRSLLIYTATVDEDRVKIWENKTALNAFNIVQGVELVDKVLKAGEKERIIDVIDDMGGFNEDNSGEIVGNSLVRGVKQD